LALQEKEAFSVKKIQIIIVTVFLTAMTTPVAAQAARPNTKGAPRVRTESVAVKMPEGMTRDQADEILKELKAIHQLLDHQRAMPDHISPPSDKVLMNVVAGWYSLGRDDAPVTVVEFADYQCPFCRKFHSETFADLKKNYIDTGKIRFVSRDLPLDFHANASISAMAARCAGEQNKFWEMRDLMLVGDTDLSSAALFNYARQIDLDEVAFGSCVSANKYTDAIQKDIADAGALGIRGTPTFVVGKTAKDQIAGIRIAGAVPYSVFEAAIKNHLTTTSLGDAPAGSLGPAVDKPR
jgi:protein-disulfide isomerase